MRMIMNKSLISNKGIILLSGGLDSVVSLAAAINNGVSVKKALFFDYGQKSFEKEYQASKNIAEFYSIDFECIKLDWMKNITTSTLVSNDDIPNVDEKDLDDKEASFESMKKVWVPNRNGLFVNIAASFADSFGYDCIIIGANKEEAQTFSDNSIEFVDAENSALKYSVNYSVKLIAPLINYNKNEIVKLGLDIGVPFEYINSCYNNTKKHCGACESCNRLKRALENTGAFEIIDKLFN